MSTALFGRPSATRQALHYSSAVYMMLKNNEPYRYARPGQTAYLAASAPSIHWPYS
jgi:hypothetical protein